MLPVLRYLESLHNTHADLTFRYVGPNEMNGQAEELQVFLAFEELGRSITIRYLDSLGRYIIEDPRDGRAHQADEGNVLTNLASVLEEYLPDHNRRNRPSA
ncbi:hypothetical protein [Pelagibius sp. Alg239-R121]|uniref:hypothetical protein n=1 Tax=Pelagibius sp. Alg239-R121 TaxID=2993448 RepID=UPI0024A75493|nr:hypothetical protein [Pelagibius sp. Alg239-R121]